MAPATVELVAVSDSGELAAFLERSREHYVAELVTSGIDGHTAHRLAAEQQQSTFADGLAAAGHMVFAVERDGERVGHVWIGPPDGGSDAWWLWDIEIDEDSRGQGVGRAALAAAEAEVAARGGVEFGLTVFGHNSRASALYESAGYRPVSTRMSKRIAPSPPA